MGYKEKLEWLAFKLVETATNIIESAKAEREVWPFLDDEEKMVDFFTLTKEQFLQSYSYLSEAEYDKTLQTCFVIKKAATKARSKLKGKAKAAKTKG